MSAARTTDAGNKTIQELIESCQVTHHAFRTAAQAVASDSLKQLFGLYAQQRSRFAAELSSLAENLSTSAALETFPRNAVDFAEEAELVRSCLAQEKDALAVYRKALAERALPTRARFLVSAQLALLERVHDRIESIENRQGKAYEQSFHRNPGYV